VKAPVIIGLFCALLPVAGAAGELYRCDEAGEAPSFQAHPCVGGEVVELGQPAAYWEPLRPAERRLWRDIRRAEKASPPPRRARSSGKASERTCWQRRRQLEALAAKLRRGYRAAQGERLRRRRDTLQGFIRRYCE
jgi:hypothetical protein